MESIDGKKVFIVGNFTPSEQEVSTPVPSGWSNYYDLMTEKASTIKAGEKIKLAPHSYVIIGNELYQ